MEIKFSEGHIQNMNINKISLEEFLINFGINPLEVIVKRNGSVILEEEMLGNKDKIQIIRVIHGG